jgi:aminopeptidase N
MSLSSVRSALILALILALDLVLPAARGQQASPSNPFAPPQARLQYAPDRDYDLQHISLDLTVEYATRSFRGVVVNTLAPLREGLTAIRLDCGENLTVTSCAIAGQQAAFRHEGDRLSITAPQPLAPGKPVAVTVRYFDSGKKELPYFHWLRPTAADPQRIGFWTAGEPYFNRQWLPTWDYPNDFATSETRVTVPADWYVVSNGVLMSDTRNRDGRTRTFHWKMEQPHATYLISLVGGPFDIKTAEWRGVKLLYVVPKGKGPLIDATFGDTPDMLSFFSDTLGVKYPWPKYAQTAAYDFPGGMENVSATTLNADILTDRRSGYKTSVGGIAHELAHQWFGDLVTCRHWGELWLNEGFADFCADLYLEHARGKNSYDQAIADSLQDYLSESRQYKRPLSTNLYADAFDSMFDSHSYKKGALVLHTLRRTLGDRAFFAGLHHYLIRYRHQPVDSHDLCAAMTEAMGINLEPFFDQWVYRPGHPVLDYAWQWDEAQKQVVLSVRQTQDTKDGTPLYVLSATVGLIGGSGMTREKIKLDRAEQSIRFDAASKPAAVLLDPDHDFLREVPTLHWIPEELPAILKYASDAADRQEAMNRMLAGAPSDAAVRRVAEAVRADSGPFPIFPDIRRLGELKREDLRALFREQMSHPDDSRRAQAIRALGQLSGDAADSKALRGLVSDREPYAIIRAAVSTLGSWDAPGNRDVFQKAAKMASPFDSVRLVALDGLAKADAAEGKALSDPAPQTTRTVMRFLSDRANGVRDSPVMTAQQRALTVANPRGNANIAGWLKGLTAFVPLACDDVAGRGIEEKGERISRIGSYRMVTGGQVWYLRFFLTAEGKVASYAIYSPGY